MIVRDFNLVGIASLPSETNPILIIDPDTMLPATQPFEAISPRHSELTEASDSIDLIELPPRDLPQSPWADSAGNRIVDAIEDVFCPPSPERAYHGLYYNDTRDSDQSP